MSDDEQEQAIIDTWHHNSQAWTDAVARQVIASRHYTDRAILDTLTRLPSSRVLDIGCGEGWLSRALEDADRSVLGVDAIAPLIDTARANGKGEFRQIPYAALADTLAPAQYDTAVCNFSLLGKNSTDTVFSAIPELLIPGGYFVVQTLHPVAGEGEYQDGWRRAPWQSLDAGQSTAFDGQCPWYFRTLASWFKLFVRHNLQLIDLKEPLNPHTNQPLSVIFISQLR